MDSIQLTQTAPSQGEKLVIYRKKNPIIRGGKTL
jgi:hypothetical protein